MSAYQSKVNQKLFFARQLLVDYETMPQRRGALAESFLFQLYLGYLFHLRHLGSNYQCSDPDTINRVEDLARQLDAGNKSPAETIEIADLESAPHSWLSRLLSAYRSCFLTSAPRSAVVSEGLIPVARIDDSPETLTPTVLHAWLDALSELVERHREVMFEC